MRKAERIRFARRKAGMSQQGLANKLGVRRSAVANWESSGGGNPSSDNLERLACALQIAYEWLATGRGVMEPPCRDVHESAATSGTVDPAEDRLLRAWRSLPAKPQRAVLQLVESYLPSGKRHAA